ncbi:MAG: MG2 domain-containing protein [Bacteroidales bacterium]
MKKLISLAFLFLISFKLFAVIPEDTTQVAEKVYLHVDRSMYTSGEDIWFKAYVIDPSTNKLSLNTNNLHVELIAPESEIVQSRIIRVVKGTGHGDFSLPDSIPSGQYRIRAYTNHMRNYGEEKFFVKEITIVDPNETDQLQLPVRKIDNKIDITFFPEGGSLIDNVTSTIGFKAVNALGKGCDVTVKLYSSSGELITIFNSTHLGMGFFNLKPLTGYTYYAIVQGTDGTEIKAPIPASFPAGVTIRTLITPDKNLIVTINTNEATLPSIIGKDLNVEVSLRNLVHKTTKLKIDSLVNNFLIPLADIPDGVLRVTLGVPDGLPLCERLVFLQRNQNERLIVTTDKIEYKPREKVSVTIALSGDSTLTDTGYFSMAVVDKKLSDSSAPYSRSITSWFLLESDVRGPVEDPGNYFDPDNDKRLQELDLLLLTQGWRDFKWKYDTLTPFKHEVGFTLAGQVNRILNNNPVSGAKINAALFHMNTEEFIDTRTDKDGKFRFEELEVYGKVRTFLSSTGKMENMQGKISVEPIIYNPPPAEKLHRDTASLEITQKELASYKQEASYRLNALKKYKLSDTISIGEVTITATKIEAPQEVKVRVEYNC